MSSRSSSRVVVVAASSSVALLLLLLLLCSFLLLATTFGASATSLPNHHRHGRKIIIRDRIIDTQHEQPTDLSKYAYDESMSQFHVHIKDPMPKNIVTLLKQEFASVNTPHYIPHNTFTVIASRKKAYEASQKLKDRLILWIKEVSQDDKISPELKHRFEEKRRQQQRQKYKQNKEEEEQQKKKNTGDSNADIASANILSNADESMSLDMDMMNPIASALLAGEEEEIDILVDPELVDPSSSSSSTSMSDEAKLNALARKWSREAREQMRNEHIEVFPVSRNKLRVRINREKQEKQRKNKRPSRRIGGASTMEDRELIDSVADDNVLDNLQRSLTEWFASKHVITHVQERERFETLVMNDESAEELLALVDNPDAHLDDDGSLSTDFGTDADREYVEQQVSQDLDTALLSDIDPLSDDYKALLLRDAARLSKESFVGQSHLPDVQYLWSKGLDGQGEIVGIGDTGIDYNSCFFRDDNVSVPFNRYDMKHRKIVGYFAHADKADYKDGHGTHVVGSLVGNSKSMPAFNGVQPAARVVFVDIGNADKTLSLPADLNEYYFPLMYNVTPISSNSWGNKRFGEYTFAAREIDQFSYEHPDFLALFAAGNSGRSGSATLTPPGTAKNCLTVGASQTSQKSFELAYPLYADLLKDQVRDQLCNGQSNLYDNEMFCSTLGAKKAPCYEMTKPLCEKLRDVRACCSNAYIRKFCCIKDLVDRVRKHPELFSEHNMATFSSRGPTKDKRLKPDLVAPGQLIFAARSDGTTGKPHCSVPLVMQGTSMATPTMAGYALAVRQYFKKGFYPSGRPQQHDAFTPSGALIKAMLINSGVSLDGMVDWNGRDQWKKLVSAPSHVQGFGLVKVSNVLKFDGETPFELFKEEHALSTGEQAQVCFRVSKATEQQLPAFKTTLVWMDYPASPSAAVTLVNNLDLRVVVADKNKQKKAKSVVYLGNNQRDYLNNVEQVTIPTMESDGTLRVIVKGVNVPHGPQRFALVATCIGCERVECKGTEKLEDEEVDSVEDMEVEEDNDDEIDGALLDSMILSMLTDMDDL